MTKIAITHDEKIAAAIAPFLTYWAEVKASDLGMVGDSVPLARENEVFLTARNFIDLEEVSRLLDVRPTG